MSNSKKHDRPQRRHGGGPMGGMMGSGEKASNFKGSMRRLLRYMRPQRTKLIIMLVAAVASVTFNLWGPKVLEKGINVISDAIFPPSAIAVTDLGMTVDTAKQLELPVNDEGKIEIADLSGTLSGDAETTEQSADQQQAMGALMQQIDLSKVNLANLGLGTVNYSALGLTQPLIDKYQIGYAVEDGKINLGQLKLNEQLVGAVMQDVQSGELKLPDNFDFVALFKKPIDFPKLGNVLLFMLGLYLISAIFGWIQQYVMADISRGVIYTLRKQVDGKLARLPLSYYDGQTRGELLSRVTNDVDNISATLQQNLVQMITSVLTVIGVLIMMLTISIPMTLICLVVLPLVFTLVGIIMKRSQKYFSEQWATTGTLNSHIEEMYSGHNVVRVFGHEKESIETFQAENEKLTSSSFKAQFVSGVVMPLMNFVNNLNFIIICVYGGLQVVSGNIKMGSVTAMMQYSRQFVQPIGQTASIMNVLQSTAASAERVFELLDAEEQLPDSDKGVTLAEPLQGRVAFEHVNFRYTPDKPLIEDITLTVQPGQRVAIVGPTGAGKTTIVNLLMRFYELNGGRITVDGTDITDVPRDELRNQFGMVLQDTWLFSGTIEENIAYGKRGEATLQEVEHAADMAHADHFIRTLSDGYNTMITDDAANISQGQRQLLTIARAFLSDPKILILDEATSSVDTRTEVLIQKAMDKLMQNRTSFIIAHRLSTIRNADLILVMRDGNIIEQGTHDALMAQQGFYAELYNSQFTEAESA